MGSLRVPWDHFKCARVAFGVTLVRFQNLHIFLMDFNDFIQIWVEVGVIFWSFWVTLGSLLAHDNDFGSLWGHFGVSLESLLTDEGAWCGPKAEMLKKYWFLKHF